MLKTCPKYRLRLFLSIDLAGSTEYKAKNQSRGDNLYPEWVKTITKGFYASFPNILKNECNLLKCSSIPMIWKKIGDEIVFCNKIDNIDHFQNCILGFKNALSKYRKVLKKETKGLDVKGAAWVGAFPFPNLSLVNANSDEDMYLNEDIESKIDQSPDEFDFLGQSIDTGFRVAKFATSDKMFLCLETAYLLLTAMKVSSSRSEEPPFRIGYYGKEILKGVLDGKPYPLFYIHTNTNSDENDFNKSEDVLLNRSSFVDITNALNFLSCFFNKEKIDSPQIDGDNVKGYIDYCKKWHEEYRINEEEQSIDKDNNLQSSPRDKDTVERLVNEMLSVIHKQKN